MQRITLITSVSRKKMTMTINLKYFGGSSAASPLHLSFFNRVNVVDEMVPEIAVKIKSG